MNILEQKRKDNLARNELMLRNLVGGAAKDLASTVEAEKESEQKVEQPERGKAYKDRLAEQALQGGRRRSSKRAATVAATRKIADSFAGELLFCVHQFSVRSLHCRELHPVSQTAAY